VYKVQDGLDVVHHRFPHVDVRLRAVLFDESVRLQAGDHLAATSLARMRVPRSSPARTRTTTSGAAPGTMSTWATPAARASKAELSLACIPPVATPSAIRRR